MAQDQSRVRSGRRWLALLLGMLALFAGTGCGTITYLTEVFRNEDNSHRAAVSITFEIDQGVYDALDVDPNAPARQTEGLREGWTMTTGQQGRSMTLRRELASLDELTKIPEELRNLGEDFSLGFVRSITATATEDLFGDFHYDFSSDILVPEMPEPSAEGSPPPVDDSDPLAAMMRDLANLEIQDPELAAALEAAPARLNIEVRLPGEIVMSQLNGADSGVLLGADGVRWSLDAEVPGQFWVRAEAQQPAATDPGEELLGSILARDANIEAVVSLAGVDEPTVAAVEEFALEIAQGYVDASAKFMSPETAYQIGRDLYRAYSLGALENAQGKPYMPALRAALPVIERMAVKARGDESYRIALSRLIDLLAGQDIERMREQSGSPP